MMEYTVEKLANGWTRIFFPKPKKNFHEADKWCKELWGMWRYQDPVSFRDGSWTGYQTSLGHIVYEFDSDQKAALFLLKWS